MTTEDDPEQHNTSCQEELGEARAEQVIIKTNEDTIQTMTNNNGCYCFGAAHKINELLATGRYAELMPNIPTEELYASSIQHPEHPEMSWLLHTARVPVLTTDQADAIGFTRQHVGDENPGSPHDSDENRATHQNSDANPVGTGVAKTFDSRCAGVGDMDATVWCCKICISNLCRPEKDIKMPPPALANLLWLGREEPLCKRATAGARLLSCLGRPVWRKLILGKGSHDESEKGIAGNFIFLAQARLSELSVTLPPWTEELQESFASMT